MIKELAKKILILFNQNAGLRQYEIQNPSLELSKIVNIILSECKCSLIDEKENYIRYGSSIDIEIVEKIILSLLSMRNEIPNEITIKALSKEGIDGPNISIQYDKIINFKTGIPEIDIKSLFPSTFDRILGKNNSEIQQKLMDEILKPYVKEIIFSNEALTKKSPIGAFISKSLFKKKTPKDLEHAYIRILKRYLKRYNKIEIRNSVKYIINNILGSKVFKKELISTSINSTELQILGKVYTGFSGLVYNMITSVLGMLTTKETPDKEIAQIKEIYYTILAVLLALSTEISYASEEQIINNIKIINRNFNIIAEKDYPEKSMYRKTELNKDLYGNKIKFVKPMDVEKAMNNLASVIRGLVTNKDKISNEVYIKEVMRINYRFIRIQPFYSANGRTSRALINILLQEKGMSAYFEKDIRLEYIKSLTEAHESISKYEQQYIEGLVNNPTECIKYEEEYLKKKIPILIVKD